MGGSYNHITNDDGSLCDFDTFTDMIENLGDAYEAVEEMYGMIWWLTGNQPDPAFLVEEARKDYRRGLRLAPGGGDEQ